MQARGRRRREHDHEQPRPDRSQRLSRDAFREREHERARVGEQLVRHRPRSRRRRRTSPDRSARATPRSAARSPGEIRASSPISSARRQLARRGDREPHADVFADHVGHVGVAELARRVAIERARLRDLAQPLECALGRHVELLARRGRERRAHRHDHATLARPPRNQERGDEDRSRDAERERIVQQVPQPRVLEQGDRAARTAASASIFGITEHPVTRIGTGFVATWPGVARRDERHRDRRHLRSPRSHA